MRGPYFLTEDQVLRLHADQIKEFGGEDGIADRGLISSSVAAPQNLWLYAKGSVFDLASAYAFHLSRDHGFLDGNKRTGAAAAIVFLRINGWIVTRGFENEMLDVAAGNRSREDLSKFLRTISRRTFFGTIANLFGSG